MAELIEKNEAKKEMWWLFNNYVNNASNFEPEETEAVNRAFGRLQSVIDNMPTTSEAEIKSKVVDEFVEKMSLEISESLIWGMLWNDRDESFRDTSDKIVDYVISTAKQIADQMKERG